MAGGGQRVALSCLNNTQCRHGPCHVGGCIGRSLPCGGIGPRATASAFAPRRESCCGYYEDMLQSSCALDALCARLLVVAFGATSLPGHSSPSHTCSQQSLCQLLASLAPPSARRRSGQTESGAFIVQCGIVGKRSDTFPPSPSPSPSPTTPSPSWRSRANCNCRCKSGTPRTTPSPVCIASSDVRWNHSAAHRTQRASRKWATRPLRPPPWRRPSIRTLSTTIPWH